MPSNGSLLDPSLELQATDFFGGDKSILEKIKKSEAAFSSLCKNEPNLSMLTSKISSILEQGMLKQRKSKGLGMGPGRKGCNLGQLDELMQQPMIQPHHQSHQPHSNEFNGNSSQQHSLMGMPRTQDEL